MLAIPENLHRICYTWALNSWCHHIKLFVLHRAFYLFTILTCTLHFFWEFMTPWSPSYLYEENLLYILTCSSGSTKSQYLGQKSSLWEYMAPITFLWEKHDTLDNSFTRKVLPRYISAEVGRFVFCAASLPSTFLAPPLQFLRELHMQNEDELSCRNPDDF